MRLLDVFRASAQRDEEYATLRSLHAKLLQTDRKRENILSRLPLPDLAGAIIDYEQIFSPPPIPPQPDPAITVLLTKLYQVLLTLRDTGQAEEALRQLLKPLSELIPPQPKGEDYGLTVSILDRLHDPIRLIDTIVKWALTSPFPRLQDTVQANLLLASGIDPGRPSRKMPVFPSDAKETAPGEMLEEYL